MKLSKNDLPLLRLSILVASISIAISGVILFSSYAYISKSQEDLRNARKLRNDSRTRLTAAHEDRDNMSIYSTEYGVLINRKIIGDEQRLDWIEGMEKVRQMNLVSNFRYHIAPQKPYTAKSPIASGNFDIRYSEMALQFELLHEAQLVNFFAALPKNIPGWYQLEGCTVQRAATTREGADRPSGPQLTAQCTGGWITLKNRNAQP
jgi:hypothetical protein